MRHVCHMRSSCLAPHAHAMWILLRIGLDGGGHATIGIAFPQDWIDGRSQDTGIDVLNGLFLVRLWFGWIERNVVSLVAEFGNAFDELRDGGRHIGEFDNVAFGCFAQFTEIGQIVGNLLRVVELVGKGSQHATSDGNITWDNVNASLGAKLWETQRERERERAVRE